MDLGLEFDFLRVFGGHIGLGRCLFRSGSSSGILRGRLFRIGETCTFVRSDGRIGVIVIISISSMVQSTNKGESIRHQQRQHKQ